METDIQIKLKEALKLSGHAEPPKEILEKIEDEMPEELKDPYYSSKELSQQINNKNTGWLVNKNTFNKVFDLMKYLSKYYSEFKLSSDGLSDYIDVNKIPLECRPILVKENYMLQQGTRNHTEYKWNKTGLIKDEDVYNIVLKIQEFRRSRINNGHQKYTKDQIDFIKDKILNNVSVDELILSSPSVLRDKTERSIRMKYNKIKQRGERPQTGDIKTVYVKRSNIPSLYAELNKDYLPLVPKRTMSIYEDLVLHFMVYNGSSYDEVAIVLGRSRGALAQRISKLYRGMTSEVKQEEIMKFMIANNDKLNLLYKEKEEEEEEIEQEKQPEPEQEKHKKEKIQSNGGGVVKILMKEIKKVKKENKRLKKQMDLIMDILSERI